MTRIFSRRPIFGGACMVGLFLVLSPLIDSPAAQQPLHLNPVIEKLQQGKVVIGVSVNDLSMGNARAIARMNVDFVRMEMEHMPMDFNGMRNFLLGMIDKAAILKKGNAQVNVAPFARFAPYASEQAHWVAKQALDIGLMGIMFNTVDTREQALGAVRSMRYPQKRGSPIMEPTGFRGLGPTNAAWFWGLPTDEYMQHADLWPLNPAGDLLSIMMIETPEGVKNIEEIASVPGVGVLRPGASGDLPMAMGLPGDAPEVKEALQKVLKTCLAHKIPCGITPNANNVQQLIKDGWRYFEIGLASDGITPNIEGIMRAVRASGQ
jgi:4-hydroxy-2-oxoheptanedioate aldolase